MNSKKIVRVIVALSVLGIITSIYLLKDHYAASSKCDFGDAISCSLVNSSIYSELFNVPVALFGIIWFIIIILMCWKSFDKPEVIPFILGWSILGIVFVVYLIFAEFILKAICPYCTVVHVITLIVLVLSIMLYRQIPKKERKINKKSLKKWLALIVILNVIPLIYFDIRAASGENYDELAQCITAKGMNMYGSFRCGVCAKQRALFGDSFQYINEIECHPQGKNAQTELCLEKGIEGTPTWILEPNGTEFKRNLGYLSIDELKEFAGC